MKTLVAMATTRSIDLQWVTGCRHHNSFSFDQRFVKLANKVEMDEILDEFTNWPDQIISFRVMSP